MWSLVGTIERMRLTDERIEEYLALIDATPERLAERAARLRARIASGEFNPQDVVLSERDGLVGSMLVRMVSEDMAFLGGASLRAESTKVVGELVAAALVRARELGARCVMTRVDDEIDFPGYGESLRLAGFSKKLRRVEYKTPVAELPSEDECSPFAWHTLHEYGFDACAALLGEVVVGDPSWEPDCEPHAWLRDNLPPEHRDGDFAQIGFIDGRPVAMLVVSVDSRDGWSSILFMGISPSARSHGLGQHLQRRGIAIMRAHGGRLYHGGTAEDNAPMRRIFERNGCREALRMTEWLWEPPG